MNANERLKFYLESNLTVTEYNNLAPAINVGEKKLTRLLNNTDVWSYDNVRDLIVYLLDIKAYPTDMTVEKFICEYGFNDLTLTEIKQLNLLFLEVTAIH